MNQPASHTSWPSEFTAPVRAISRVCQTRKPSFTSTLTRNLAIAKRSCVSCAHNTSRASRPIVTLKLRLAVTESNWKRQHSIDHNSILLVELFDVEYHVDLEMWVTSDARQNKRGQQTNNIQWSQHSLKSPISLILLYLCWSFALSYWCALLISNTVSHNYKVNCNTLKHTTLAVTFRQISSRLPVSRSIIQGSGIGPYLYLVCALDLRTLPPGLFSVQFYTKVQF